MQNSQTFSNPPSQWFGKSFSSDCATFRCLRDVSRAPFLASISQTNRCSAIVASESPNCTARFFVSARSLPRSAVGEVSKLAKRSRISAQKSSSRYLPRTAISRASERCAIDSSASPSSSLMIPVVTSNRTRERSSSFFFASRRLASVRDSLGLPVRSSSSARSTAISGFSASVSGRTSRASLNRPALANALARAALPIPNSLKGPSGRAILTRG